MHSNQNRHIYINNRSKEAFDHFKADIEKSTLIDKMKSEPDLDPSHNYNIIEDILVTAKHKYLVCKKVKFQKIKA